jgi:hypothetical protein
MISYTDFLDLTYNVQHVNEVQKQMSMGEGMWTQFERYGQVLPLVEHASQANWPTSHIQNNNSYPLL